MLPLAYYLLKVIICSGILYGYYWLLLRNKIFHKYNRFYLMVSVVLSLLMPLIKINFWQPTAEQPSGVIKVLQVVSSGDEYMDNIIVSTNNNAASFDVTQLYPFAYLLVSLILLTVFLHTLFVIFNLLKKYPKQTIDKISFINTDAKSTPFSFLNYIFWNHNIDMQTITGNQIFKHEVAHVEEKHTYDKLFINIVLIFFWCNPFYWLYRKELNMIHEFIADKKAVEDSDTEAFAAMILQATYPQHRFQLTNNFFYSPIKRRLLMLIKNKNAKVNYVGRIMILPLAVVLFAAFTFKIKDKAEVLMYKGKKITVVIDAGHGGNDVGAKGVNGIFEKEITLAIAKKVKELNTNIAIEIILTRETDIYQPPIEKAAFANKNNASMFISLHCDAQPTSVAIKHSGLSIWVPKNDNAYIEKSKQLGNAFISSFKQNYGLPVLDNVIQTNAAIRIFKENNYPAILIETGVITTPTDAAYISKEKSQELIAKNILNGVNDFATSQLFTQLPVQKALVDSPPPSATNSTKIEIVEVTDSPENKELLKSPKITSISMDLDSKETLARKGVIIINGKVYTPDELNNKTIKGGVGKIYKKGNAALIKKYGENAANGVIILENATITDIEITNQERSNYKNTLTIKMDSIVFITDDNAKKLNLLTGNISVDIVNKTTPLYVIDGKIEEDETKWKAIAPNDIERIDVLKDKASIEKYGERGKNGVVKITTKNNKHDITQAVTIEAGNASVALDKMNILYIGIENPVTIAVPNVKPQDLIVNISSGTISGANGKYIVKVYSTAAVNITLAKRDGTKIPGIFNFKVMRVPDPTDKITYSNFEYKIEPKLGIDGVHKTRMNAEQFKTAKKLTAGTGYEIESGTVYFGGAGFKNVISVRFTSGDLNKLSEFINRCVAGTMVSFDNVKVKGDNGYYATIDGLSISLFEEDKKSVTEVYSVPLKVHLFNEGKINTYNMVGNGDFTTSNQLLYVNGKLNSNSATIKKENVTAIELYDAVAGKIHFGDKGKNGVVEITTKSKM